MFLQELDWDEVVIMRDGEVIASSSHPAPTEDDLLSQLLNETN